MQNIENAEEIYSRYSNTVYKYLFCLTQDGALAEDLTQETFAIAIQKMNSFRYDCKFSVWLCQIAKNLWYAHLKKIKNENHISFDEIDNFIVGSNSVEDVICGQDEKLNLYKKIQKLDEPYKNVVYLKLSGNLSFVEIAEILGKTPNWVRVTFFRAKQKLIEGGNCDEKRTRL